MNKCKHEVSQSGGENGHEIRGGSRCLRHLPAANHQIRGDHVLPLIGDRALWQPVPPKLCPAATGGRLCTLGGVQGAASLSNQEIQGINNVCACGSTQDEIIKHKFGKARWKI